MDEMWPRPVPTVGDQSSASGRAADPRGWAFPPADRDALHRILAARRDIRRFRPDPVDDQVLARILAAAHAAPSVGHSQPWRFVLVIDDATRARAAVLADRARLAQAGAMDPAAARHLLDLDLEGIREAPLGLVVCCDRRVAPEGVLGRATFVEADMWSCACAIENLWLAARAEGLGVGWVTLFEPGDLAELVAAPAGVVTLGWLCVGWPDERPPAPGLERRGWSRRLPLDELVVRDRWPDAAAAPLPPASRVASPASRVASPALPSLVPPAQAAVVAAHDTGDRILTPPGSLGILDRAVDRIIAVRGSRFDPAAGGLWNRMHPIEALANKIESEGSAQDGAGWLVIAAADHPVTAHGVSAYPTSVTRHVTEAAMAGTSVGAVAARQAGLAVVVVDAGVEGPPVEGARPARPLEQRGDLVNADALTAADAERLVGAGVSLGAELTADGPDGLIALGEIGVGNTTVAAALAAGMLGTDPGPLVGLGAGSDSAIVEAKRRAVVAAVDRYRSGRPAGGSPFEALAALGGSEIAVLAGVILGVAAGGGVVVLDGMATCVAALVAVELEPAAAAHLVAGQRSREAGHQAVLEALGLEPLLDLRIRAGEGAGAALAVTVLRAGLRIRSETARVREPVR